MRAKRTAYNSLTELLQNIALIVTGLILPRLILYHFGSDYYGVMGSITQFLGYISLLTAGVGGVTIASLYKPLAEQDVVKISGIVRATEIFMRKVALIFVGILFAVATLFPLLLMDNFDWLFVFSLTLILGIGTSIQFFFGLTYRLLLIADQRRYIFALVQTFTIILNTGIAAILIFTGHELRIVMLASAAVFAINPLFLFLYVRKRYNIDHAIPPDNTAIKQRWDAFAHQIASFVNTNAPILIMTVFTNIWEVAVFVVYFLILRKIIIFVKSLSGSGIGAAFGNMLANGEHETIRRGLRLYEFTSNMLATIIISCTAVLIVPFIAVYTSGIDDVNYYRPLFAVLACIAVFFDITRIPYQSIVDAAGHFRQTRTAAFIEIGINITVSVLLVQWFGLVGVVMGMLCSLIFRTIFFAIYVSKHLVVRSMWFFMRRMLVSVFTIVIIVAIASMFPGMTALTYFAWILHALPVFGVAVGVTALSILLFYREEARMLWAKVRSMVKG